MVSAGIYWVNMEVKSEEGVAFVKHTLPALKLDEGYKNILPASCSQIIYIEWQYINY